MLRSNLCDYVDPYILVKGAITTTGTGDDEAAKQLDERNKGVIFKNCDPYTKCISRINNTDIDISHDIDIVMPMYNLIEYSDNYSKTSVRLWQYYKDEPNDNFYLYKMTQHKSLNVKLSNSQFNKLTSAIKNESEVVLRLSSNMIGDNETNFPRKAFANYLSTDIKSGGFLCRLLGPLLKTALPLIKNVIKPLTKGF